MGQNDEIKTEDIIDCIEEKLPLYLPVKFLGRNNNTIYIIDKKDNHYEIKITEIGA